MIGPLLLALLLGTSPAVVSTDATSTRVLALSGEGPRDATKWEFRCLGEGRRCVAEDADPGAGWTTIRVPSQWQQEGFGAYSYGHDEDKPETIGEYRRVFSVPPDWAGGRIDLVFEGVMTDTEVRLNGMRAGPVHRGGFYRFSYDVTDLVELGTGNFLEVRVRERSEDRSVEKAERDADYWVFGGIYRPVRLRWRPAESIDHVAIDAKHDGRFRARVRFAGLDRKSGPATLRLEVWPVGVSAYREHEPIEIPVDVDDASEITETWIEGHFDGVEAWSAEKPFLHRARFTLQRDGRALHAVEEVVGFRTIELRNDGEGGAEDGLFVNGQRTLLRGVNRHAFHPATGRALDDSLDWSDAYRIKSLGLNAVRASHYPPDISFLRACDEIGLYVIDELAGWHDAYSTKAGRPLVRSMVERDGNHPSIILWANGNEDGWNKALDDDFALHDPQARPVLHPRSNFRGVDAPHYLDWQELEAALDPSSWTNRRRGVFSRDPLPLFLPTEILHGLYDGGSGAGLADFWERIRRHPRAMGLFLWAFVDEAIERTDRDAEGLARLDTDGNHAPDGVLGPYREPSANSRALQEVFTPVRVRLDLERFGPDDPLLVLENHFDHVDLRDVHVGWRFERLGVPLEVLAAGTFRARPADPGESVHHLLPAPPPDADALRVTIHGPEPFWGADGPPIFEIRFPLESTRDAARRLVDAPPAATPTDLAIEVERGVFTLTSGEERLVLPLPVATGQDASPGERPRPIARRAFETGRSRVEELRFEGRLQRLRFEVFPSGWTRLAWTLDEDREDEKPREGEVGEILPGIVFPLGEGEIDSMAWIGLDDRLWRNRVHGLWGPSAVTATADPGLRWAHETKFRGYYSARRARLDGSRGAFTLHFESDDVWLGLYAPRFPDDAEDARASVHAPDGLALVHRLPVIGTKFKPGPTLEPPWKRSAERLGPRGLWSGAVWIAPGDLPSP